MYCRIENENEKPQEVLKLYKVIIYHDIIQLLSLGFTKTTNLI